MKDYKVKDKILRKLSEIEPQKPTISTMEMAAFLKVSHEQVYACCFEMAKRDHINAMNIATKGAKFAYEIYSHPVGENFITNNGGYTRELNKERWDSFPQRKWWLIAIFSFLVGFIVDVAKPLITAYIQEKAQYLQKDKATQTKFDTPNKSE